MAAAQRRGPVAPERQWGADFISPETARFRLWAPAEKTVRLRLDGRDIAMEQVEGGWFETTTEARAGMAYAFVLGDGLAVPDPAARAQAGDVHGPSLLVDPLAFNWRHTTWKGRPWNQAVIYEMHIGTFTPEGTFRAAIEKLPHLVETGITAIEIMPVAQFSGDRGWGYDGVMLYAPHRVYGSPDDLRALIDAAHGHGLMVLLDVVYNHFGPDGNYLGRYAPGFFDPDRHTPWGAAIAYEKEPVRRFFIDNALYWLREYRLDGLRLDAIDQIHDETSPTGVLVEIARTVRAEITGREIHLTTEDSRNITRLHERGPDGAVPLYTAEWNDDFHNSAHVAATGEGDGYYADFTDNPTRLLARSLAEGFAYQGQASAHSGGRKRGSPSAHMPPGAFIDFIQNHDQIGNRAFGDRLVNGIDPTLYKALTAILLLSPHIPLVFMGEEFAETRPFLFFTDFEGDLAQAVRDGRRREFKDFKTFADEGVSLSRIPDPNAPSTFEACKIDWEKAGSAETREWRDWFRTLLHLRSRHVMPLIADAGGDAGRILESAEGTVAVDWRLGDRLLQMRANLSAEAVRLPVVRGDIIWSDVAQPADNQDLPPFGVVTALSTGAGGRAP